MIRTLQGLFDLAQQHGDCSDGDHEVGDLQDCITLLWDLLPAELQPTALAKLNEHFHEELEAQGEQDVDWFEEAEEGEPLLCADCAHTFDDHDEDGRCEVSTCSCMGWLEPEGA